MELLSIYLLPGVPTHLGTARVGSGKSGLCPTNRPRLTRAGASTGLLIQRVRVWAEAGDGSGNGHPMGLWLPRLSRGLGGGRGPEMESVGWAEGGGDTRPPGWVISLGFMAGLVILRVWGLEASQQLRHLPLTPLVPSRGLSFPSHPGGPGPSQPWHLGSLCRWLGPGQQLQAAPRRLEWGASPQVGLPALGPAGAGGMSGWGGVRP